MKRAVKVGQGIFLAVVLLLVFVLPAKPAIAALLPTVIITVGPNNEPADGDSVGGTTVGLDNNLVAFQSGATNFVAGAPSAANSDMFIKNLKTGALTLISTSSSGTVGNNSVINYPSISEDGRYVVFLSDATNMVTGDTNNARDVFLKDLQTGTTTRVDTDSSGAQANAATSGSAFIARQGRYVVFGSSASNLVAGDTNAAADIFVKDLQTGTTTRVSTSSTGTQGNAGISGWAAISGDGRYVAFRSNASNLVAGDTNGALDIFLKDLQTGITTRVSTDSSGAQASAGVSSPNMTMSPDGRYLVFVSASTNLVVGDTNGVADVFVKDLQTGTTTRVSTDASGAQLNAASGTAGPTVSTNGRYIAFDSNATNAVPGSDTNGIPDLFIKDITTGEIVKLSTNVTGGEMNGTFGVYPLRLTMSMDDRYVYFSSDASNLVTNTTNGFLNVYARQNPFWVDTTSSSSSSQSSGGVTVPGAPNTGQALINSVYPKLLMIGGAIASAIGAIALYRLRIGKTAARR